jgi:hypothetical protein
MSLTAAASAAKRYNIDKPIVIKKDYRWNSDWTTLGFGGRETFWKEHTHYYQMRELNRKVDLYVQAYMTKRLIFSDIDRTKRRVWGVVRRGSNRQLRRRKKFGKNYFLTWRLRQKSIYTYRGMFRDLTHLYNKERTLINFIQNRIDLIRLSIKFMSWFYNSIISKKFTVFNQLVYHNTLALLGMNERRKGKLAYVIPLFKRKDTKDIIEI